MHWLQLDRLSVPRTACVALLAVVVSQFLAGYALLWSFKLDPRRATPFTLTSYAYHYGNDARVAAILKIGWIGTGLSVAAAIAASAWRRPMSLHGAAEFAGVAEIGRMGLFGEEGIILGQHEGRYLILPGQQSVLVDASTRSGKSAGVMIPNLLNWAGSVVAQDVKWELWRATAGYRQRMGQECHLYSPLDPMGRTARSNPFSYVGDDPDLRINDLQLIGGMLFPDEPGTDPFWISSARSLFVGLGLYVFETASLPPTIGEVLRQGMGPHAPSFSAHWKATIDGRAHSESPLSSLCVRLLSDVIDLAPVTISSIRKTFTSRLELWTNPLIDAATSGNDFDLRDLRRKQMSIYVGIKPRDLKRLRPLLAIFYQQCIALQTDELPEENPELIYQLLMALDEFTSPGKIPIIADATPYLGGYNVRALMLIQAQSQLRETYGPNAADTIMTNLGARVVFAQRRYSDAKEISEDLGYITVKVKSHSRPRYWSLSTAGTHAGSTTVSEQRRALMLPQELQQMGRENQIVFLEGSRPIFCKKIRYFADRRFKQRLFDPPSVRCRVKQSVPARRVESREGDASMNGIAPTVADSPTVMLAAGEQEALATPNDISRLESLTLDDFAADFSAVELPENRQMTAEELSRAVNQFMAALNRE